MTCTGVGKIVAAALICGLHLGNSTARSADWPQFGRDGTRNAVSPEMNPPTNWDVGETDMAKPGQRTNDTSRNIKWSAKLGSLIYGDPVISQGLVWVGTNNYDPLDKAEVDASVLACLRESDGKLLYRYVSPRLPQGRVHDWSQASMACSPLIEKDRLWLVTNRAEVVCLDIAPLQRDGSAPKVVWKVDMIGKFGVFPRGSLMNVVHLCSIAGYRDFIYVITGNGVNEGGWSVAKPDAPSLICFQKATGDTVWQDNSPGQNILYGQWSSPTIIEIEGRAQCLTPQGDGWLRSFDALSGTPIWQFDMNFKRTVWKIGGRGTRNHILSTPVLYENRVYLASGQHPIDGEGVGRLVCLDPTRSGDISSELAVNVKGKVIPHRRVQAIDPAQGEKAIPNQNSGLVWEFIEVGKKFEQHMHRMVANVSIDQGLVIAADFSGGVHCLDAKTGKHCWSYDGYSSVYGSPLIVDEKVYVGDEEGNLSIVGLSSDPETAMHQDNGAYQPLHVIPMGSSIYCSPVFANGVLYVASRDGLFAIAAEKEEASPAPGGYWPQWRGPNRDNVSIETGLLNEWPAEGPPRVWTAVGLGEGIASVSVAEGKIITLGYLNEDEFVIALDEATGGLSWATRIGPAVAESWMMRWLSQRAPTVDGERLYTVTAAGELVCLNTAEGRELWRKSYPADFQAKRPQWGFCDRPLVDGDKLICTPGAPQAAIVAIDKKNGNVLWQTVVPGGQDHAADYGAVVVAEVEGLRQYITFLSKALISVAADDGRLLWMHSAGIGASNSHTPIVRNGQIFYSSQSVSGLLKLVRNEQGATVESIHHAIYPIERFEDSIVLVGDHLYSSGRGGSCLGIDWKTGQTWTNLIPAIEDTSRKLAIMAAEGNLYIRSSTGKMVLVHAAPERYLQKGVFSIPDHQDSFGVTFPVIAGRRLYLRDNDRLHCYDIRADALIATQASPRTISLAFAATIPKTDHPRRAANGVFVPTPHDVVSRMLELAQVKKSDSVCDMGCGDGRIVIAAAKQYGCHAIGYDIDAELVALSRRSAKSEGVDKLVLFDRADIYLVDLTQTDVVTLYLLPLQIEKLLPQLNKLKSGGRIVSHQFEIPGIKPDKTMAVESKESGEKHTLYLYSLPLQKKPAD